MLLTIHSLSHSIPPISLSPVAINILFTVFRSAALFGQIYLRVLYIFVIFLSLLDWRGRVGRLGPDLTVLWAISGSMHHQDLLLVVFRRPYAVLGIKLKSHVLQDVYLILCAISSVTQLNRVFF